MTYERPWMEVAGFCAESVIRTSLGDDGYSTGDNETGHSNVGGGW